MICLSMALTASVLSASLFPASSEDLERLLTEIVSRGRNAGVAAAVITPEGTFQAHAGISGSADGLPLSSQTLFEIGSITKVVTGTLFADSIRRGEVREDERLVEVFPDLVLPGNGDKITLLDLATHRSGIPSCPADLTPADWEDPWKDLTKEALWTSLSKLKELNFEPGSEAEYSNAGTCLLGHALVSRSRLGSFEALVQTRFAQPLGLSPSQFTADSGNEKIAASVAQGNNDLGRTSHWHLGFISPAGGIVASLDAMTKFARACLTTVNSAGLRGSHDIPSDDIITAMSEAQTPRQDFSKHEKVGLNWFSNDDVFWHNGGTGGFRSWMGCHKESGRAAVVLTNSAKGLDSLGMHLVKGSPLELPLSGLHAAVQLATTQIDRLLGTYSMGQLTIAVERCSSQNSICAYATGGFKMNNFHYLIPDSELRWRSDSVSYEFHLGDDGTITGFDESVDGKLFRRDFSGKSPESGSADLDGK